MKRLIYACSMLALVASFALAGRTYAAHVTAPSKAPMAVQLCVSVPLGVPALKDLSIGIENGAALAVSQWKAKYAKAGLHLVPQLNLDYAKSDGSGYSTDQERLNALRCLSQSNTLGYVGTLNSGAALVSEPVLNRGGMTMISPSNTNPSLTDPKMRAAQEPSTFSGKLKYVTYYRTVTTDNLQGPAGAAYAHKLGVKSFFLVDDKLTYGAGLAGTFTAYAKAHLGMSQAGTGHIDPSDSASIASSSDSVSDQVLSSHADGVYCGCDSENAITFVRDLRQKGYTKPVVGGDALVNQTFVTSSGKGSVNDFATSVGPDPAAAGHAFIVAYHKKFHGFAIQAYDATAYDGANIVLQGIYLAHKAGVLKGSKYHERAVVNKYVAHIHYTGATGLTTFDKNGDTTNRIISIYAVKGNAWVFKALAPVIKGIKPV